MCEEIDRRFGGDPDPILRQDVAQALSYKGNALVERHRWDEAAAAMVTVVARYGEDADPVLRSCRRVLGTRSRSARSVLAPRTTFLRREAAELEASPTQGITVKPPPKSEQRSGGNHHAAERLRPLGLPSGTGSSCRGVVVAKAGRRRRPCRALCRA